MRTKTLILTLALSAAGIASSFAQVYSVNAVGYVNLTIPAGKFALYSNPLIGATNTLNALFPTAPLGTFLYTVGPGGFIVTYNDSFGAGWLDEMANPAGDTRSVSNGQAFLMWNPDVTDYTITFVGEVAQGTVVNDIPINFSMRGSKIPQAGRLQTDLGFPASPGDLVSKFNLVSQTYEVFSVDSFAMEPASPTDWYDSNAMQVEPTVTVGQGLLIFKPIGLRNWSRNFTVN